MDLKQLVDAVGNQTQAQVQEALVGLRSLIALTEEKYAYIYETLPVKERDINTIVKEVEILLDYLIYDHRSGDGLGRSSVITGALAQIRREFAEVTESFLNRELVEMLRRTFLHSTEQKEKSFLELTGVVKEVNDTLGLLRDLALNSIIYSIRTGADGAGFQILADRINEISGRLGQEFKEIDAKMQQLDKWNNDFQEQLAGFIKSEENHRTLYQQQCNTEFTRIEEVLSTICFVLNDHLAQTKDVIARVPEAMVLIQNQDIIRQNIENLIKCLQLITDKKNALTDESREEVLNLIVFLKKSSELAIILLDNIEAGLEDSILTLEKVLGEIAEQAADLSSEAIALGGFFAGGRNSSHSFNLMKHVFRTVKEQVSGLNAVKADISDQSLQLSKGSEVFIQLMGEIDNRLATINKEVRTLKKMRVLLKIELTRINHGSDKSMGYMGDVVEQVIYTVNENQNLFNRLKAYLVTNISNLEQALKLTRDRLSGTTEALMVSEKKLQLSEELATGAVHAMIAEMGELFTELQSPYQNIQVMSRIKQMMSSVRSEIRSYDEFLGQQMKALFDYFGVSRWEEKEEDLNVLLQQFTCFSERKSANAVFDEVSTELGGDSCDIVLF